MFNVVEQRPYTEYSLGLMAIPAEYNLGTLSDCVFICKAADTPVGHADELVQHHSRHVALGEVGDGSTLAKLNLIEAEVG